MGRMVVGMGIDHLLGNICSPQSTATTAAAATTTTTTTTTATATTPTTTTTATTKINNTGGRQRGGGHGPEDLRVPVVQARARAVRFLRRAHLRRRAALGQGHVRKQQQTDRQQRGQQQQQQQRQLLWRSSIPAAVASCSNVAALRCAPAVGCVCECVRVCVRTCVGACVCACVRACCLLPVLPPPFLR